MKRKKPSHNVKSAKAPGDEADPGRLLNDLVGAFQALFTIPGVEGIGQSVTILSPYDLPLEFVGFIERLKAGAIEDDEEMVLLTIPTSPAQGHKRHPVADRFRKSVLLLCRHALDNGLSVGEVTALLEAAKQELSPAQIPPAERARKSGKTSGATSKKTR